MLVSNAENLMKSVVATLKAAEAASVKVNTGFLKQETTQRKLRTV